MTAIYYVRDKHRLAEAIAHVRRLDVDNGVTWRVTVERFSTRSQAQNDFYMVLLGALARHVGLSRAEVHRDLKLAYLGGIVKQGGRYVDAPDTHDLQDQVFGEFLAWVEAIAASIGVRLPNRP